MAKPEECNVDIIAPVPMIKSTSEKSFHYEHVSLGSCRHATSTSSQERRVISEEEHPGVLASAWPSWKKWMVLTVIFLVQTSMNFNTSLYSNGLKGIAKEFDITTSDAVSGAAVFLVTYAFGCELWAPWSEELGRWVVLQGSLLMVNLMCLPVALAPNFQTVLVGRALGGLFSAGGSVTLGMVADMFDANTQQHAVAYIVLSSVGGSIFGPIVGGFVETYLPWQWTIWIQLLFSAFVQILHFFFVPETRSTSLLDRHAKRLRKQGAEVYGPTELKTLKEYLAPSKLLACWTRPFKMFVTEPIVLSLSLLSGFTDALIFMQIQSLGLIYELWNFNTIQLGLAFIPIGLGYLFAYLSFLWAIKRNMALRSLQQNQTGPKAEYAQFESRLWWLLYTAPCLPIGMMIVAWTSNPSLHWILPMIGSGIVGIANYAIYMASVDYLVAAYGPYSASATGGNGFARDLLAGILTWAAVPYYEAFQGPFRLQISNTVWAAVGAVLVASAMIVYWKGPMLRKRSRFAQRLQSETWPAQQVYLVPVEDSIEEST